jgi:hypothetical protein
MKTILKITVAAMTGLIVAKTSAMPFAPLQAAAPLAERRETQTELHAGRPIEVNLERLATAPQVLHKATWGDRQL